MTFLTSQIQKVAEKHTIQGFTEGSVDRVGLERTWDALSRSFSGTSIDRNPPQVPGFLSLYSEADPVDQVCLGNEHVHLSLLLFQ